MRFWVAALAGVAAGSLVGRTVVAVAHRPALLGFVDRVVCLTDGLLEVAA